MNRFLLCALVRESAKQLKAKADRAGEDLPITAIVRGVLRSYRQVARDEPGLLSKPGLNLTDLKSLNDKILEDEVSRLVQERVKISQMRLAHANWLGDETGIKTAEDARHRAILARDQVGIGFKQNPVDQVR